MKKFIFSWGPRVFLCLLILFFLAGVVAYLINSTGEPPDREEAPWALQTYSNDKFRIPSRIYYASDMEISEDGTPIAKAPYWSYDGKNFKKHNEDKSFPQSDYGEIDITRR